MLEGHAFARAVRGHFIATTALSNKIVEEIQMTGEEQSTVMELLGSFLDESPSLSIIKTNPTIQQLAMKIGSKMEQLKDNGPTAKLWILYFKMVYLIKEYIHAERSGDWEAHLTCVKRMIPFFHAAGHFPYAKSCQLYVQDMEKLPNTMPPDQYQKFVKNGYFTMRRSDRFWSGVWSDMTIETTLMRSFKSRGGITGGRGVAHSVLSKWVVGMNATHEICTSLEEFCGVLFTSSEQHKDIGEARRSRDLSDVAKVSQWFENHPPFPETSEIMSIASGVVGDASINCYDAIRVGQGAMEKIVGVPFSKIKLSRKDRVLPLSAVTSSITVHEKKVVVDPTILFQRICIAKRSEDDLKTFLEYELAPFPLSLFNENGMRKTAKYSLYSLFQPTMKDIQISQFRVVVDGGHLIHKVVWPKESTISAICKGYVTYLKQRYPGKTCTVVFDGYLNSANCTKLEEHRRRYRLKRSVDMHLTTTTTITGKQEDFLSNVTNKSQLISLLQANLQEHGIDTLQATDDADLLIVTTAVKQSSNSSVAVVGEDIDLAVLLMGLTPIDNDILFLKPGRGKAASYALSTQEMQELGLKHIIFIHAFSGCDTTSATFRKSKICFSKLYQRSDELKVAAEVFYSHSSSQNEVDEAGILCFLRWYGAPSKVTSLNQYRFEAFKKTVAKIRSDITSLPPTEGAARQHSRRTYHQVQQWLGNDLPPQKWGWMLQGSNLVPITTEDPPAPQVLLKSIFCRCVKDCGGGKCSCRKAMLNCSAACLHCQGKCTNSVTPLEEDDDYAHDPLHDPLQPPSADEEDDLPIPLQPTESPPDPTPGHSIPKRRRLID